MSKLPLIKSKCFSHVFKKKNCLHQSLGSIQTTHLRQWLLPPFRSGVGGHFSDYCITFCICLHIVGASSWPQSVIKAFPVSDNQMSSKDAVARLFLSY